MIRNVVFDMGQVLIHWTPALLVQPFGLTSQEETLVLRELFQSVEWVCLDRGSMTGEEVITSVCARLPENLHGCVRELVSRWDAWVLSPMEGMAELLRELKEKGMHIYLLSNANRNLRSYFPRIPGSECFDGLMVSAEERLLKPQHEIFEALLSRFGLKAEECFFVDDAPANVEGAGEAGISGAIFYGDVKRLRRDLRNAGIPVEA